jgi:hypothetical protein
VNTLLGPVPDTWTATTIGDTCLVQAGPSGTTYRRADRTPTGTPVITPMDIRDNRIILDNCHTVGPETVCRLSRYTLQPGDIICTRIGETRRHALADEDHTGWIDHTRWLLSAACIFIRPQQAVLPKYLDHYLRHPLIQTWITQRTTGAAVPTITADTLRTLPLVLPPRESQHAIADTLEALDKKITAHRKIAQIATEMRDTLTPALLTGAISPDGTTPYD